MIAVMQDKLKHLWPHANIRIVSKQLWCSAGTHGVLYHISVEDAAEGHRERATRFVARLPEEEFDLPDVAVADLAAIDCNSSRQRSTLEFAVLLVKD